MTILADLKNCKTKEDFTQIINSINKRGIRFTTSGISSIFWRNGKPIRNNYTTFIIKKKSGGERKINAPIKSLKILQKRLADILSECFAEITKNKRPLSHGFRKHSLKEGKGKKIIYGIYSNANIHKGKRYVLNIDLKDFFPSFNFGRVRGFFIKSKDFELDAKIATLIAQIACYNNELPQGSPCSPIITNLISHILDIHLVSLAKEYRCNYSRYADDITFSTNLKAFPDELATEKDGKWRVGKKLSNIIKNSNFSLNESKIRLQYKPSRQIVTGLVVNRKVNIRREYLKYARAMCHSLFVNGCFTLPEKKETGNIKQLDGILAHIYNIKNMNMSDQEKKELQIKKEKAQKNKDRVQLDSFSELYSNFLFYKFFISFDSPLIMTEGKTDIIYLKSALKQLAKNKKNIVDNRKTKTRFNLSQKVSFFRNTSRVREVMRIYEGANPLKNFIQFYKKRTNFCIDIIRTNPVIIIVDNDKEGKIIKNFITGDNILPSITLNNTDIKDIAKSALKEKTWKQILGSRDCLENFLKKLCNKNDVLKIKKQKVTQNESGNILYYKDNAYTQINDQDFQDIVKNWESGTSNGKSIFHDSYKKIKESLYYVFDNLYVIILPNTKKNIQNCTIEDFFYQKTLQEKYQGKCFSKDNEHDTKKHYGKNTFATKIVARKQRDIDFQEFKDILELIDESIKDFEDRKEKMSKEQTVKTN